MRVDVAPVVVVVVARARTGPGAHVGTGTFAAAGGLVAERVRGARSMKASAVRVKTDLVGMGSVVGVTVVRVLRVVVAASTIVVGVAVEADRTEQEVL